MVSQGTGKPITEMPALVVATAIMTRAAQIFPIMDHWEVLVQVLQLQAQLTRQTAAEHPVAVQQAERSQPTVNPETGNLITEMALPVLVVAIATRTRAEKAPPMEEVVTITARISQMRNLIHASLLCLMSILLPNLAWAESVGTITHLGGLLRATRADGTSRILSVKSEVNEGDTLQTEKDTFARIKFVDGGEVVLRPESVFKVDAYSYRPVASPEQKDNALFNLVKGGMRSVTGLLGKRSPDAFKVNTVTATIGIRGTHFGALLCNNDCANIPTVSGKAPDNGLYTDTASGKTVISNAAGTVEVPAGSFSYTASPTTPPKLVPPSQGIQVTMPAAISNNKSNGHGVGGAGSNSCSVGG